MSLLLLFGGEGPTQGGFRSFFAFWMGGGAIVPSVATSPFYFHRYVIARHR